MQQKGLTLSIAESITCGMAAEKLATAFGTSDVFQGAVICYTPEVKRDVLKVPQKMIDKYTCESMQVTEVLAANIGKIIKADVCAAITGLASPGGSENKNKPVGTVFICFAYKNKKYKKKYLFRGTPVQIRKKASMALFELIIEKM